ncbi:MAG: helix-turn-helix transcriptional regulator [Candidatus Schekmanbacteria bacterium]|nr:helix-turn-helix transcriptional regulator [Candidatus Schekmanbacteria bacterium]
MIGKKIKELRKSRSWSQEDLCQKAGLKREYLSRVENGHLTPTMFTLLRIAKVLEISLSELVDNFTPTAPKNTSYTEASENPLPTPKVEQEPDKFPSVSNKLEKEIDEAVNNMCTEFKARLKTIVNKNIQ